MANRGEQHLASVSKFPRTNAATGVQVEAVTNPALRTKMVGWYDPDQLARTAGEVIVSTIFGRHADHRLIEALADGSHEIFDYTLDEENSPRQEIGNVGEVVEKCERRHHPAQLAFNCNEPPSDNGGRRRTPCREIARQGW